MERTENVYSKYRDDEYVLCEGKHLRIDYFAKHNGKLVPVVEYDNGYGGNYVIDGKRQRVSREEFSTADIEDILEDEMSHEELIYMGCSGAQQRGVPLDVALKHYGITEEQYNQMKEKYDY